MCIIIYAMKEITSTVRRAINKTKNPRLAEQDYLECVVLDALFRDDYIFENFIFTGGATLSKSYSIGGRIGRDIDLGLINFTDIPHNHTQKQLGNFKKRFKRFTFGELREKIAQIINADGRFEIITDHDWPSPENSERVASSPALHMLYQSEFGPGHLCIEVMPRHYRPSCITCRALLPYSIDRPFGAIPTISYEQTFWDKVFALHSNANTTKPHCDKSYSRHYYDVAMLTPFVDLDKTHDLLIDTIEYQTRHTTKKIDLTAARDAIIIPDDKTLYKLSDDYYAMSCTFTEPQTSWNTIVQILQNLNQDFKSL